MDLITLAIAKKYADKQRIAYSDVAIDEYIPTTTVDGFVYYSDFNISLAPEELVPRDTKDAILAKIPIVDNAGQIPITVEFDGVTYETTAYAVYSEPYLRFDLEIGNMALYPGRGSESTGEPFLIFVGDTKAVLATDEAEKHTFRVYSKTETIHHIDPKYLPPLMSPSGKSFKLTVDDSGTITAVEV